MKLKTAIVGLTLIGGVTVVLSALLAPAPSSSSPNRIALPANTVVGGKPHIHPSPAPALGLGHEQAPDPETLRDAPHRQAVYDAEAQPGEFVTPPNVSIEH